MKKNLVHQTHFVRRPVPEVVARESVEGENAFSCFPPLQTCFYHLNSHMANRDASTSRAFININARIDRYAKQLQWPPVNLTKQCDSNVTLFTRDNEEHTAVRVAVHSQAQFNSELKQNYSA